MNLLLIDISPSHLITAGKEIRMRGVLLLIPLLLISCTGSNDISTPSLGLEFSLKPGQQTSISGEDLNVQFKSVTNDSRCPTGAQCIWAGNAEVNVELSKAGSAASTVQLNTAETTSLPSQATYLNYTIQVTGLQPTPEVNATIAQSDYIGRFIVTKQ